MAKYLLLKHYRGAPAPADDVPIHQWSFHDIEARIAYMGDFVQKLADTGEYIDSQALAPDVMWVQYNGTSDIPITDGRLTESKDRIAGWTIIDVDSQERAIELAGELLAAPGAGGQPIHEWLEVRPFLALHEAATD